MDKKKSLQLSLIILLILSSIVFYKKFFNKNISLTEKKINEKEITDNDDVNKNKDNQRTKQTPGQTTTQKNTAKSDVYTPIESMVDLSKVDPKSLSFDKDEFINKCASGFPQLSFYPNKGLTKNIIDDDLKNGCKNDNLDKCSIESLSCHQSRKILTSNSDLNSLPEEVRNDLLEQRSVENLLEIDRKSVGNRRSLGIL